jgi:hypothetical protein
MTVPKHPTLLRRRIDARVKQLAADKPVLAASLVEIARKCGRKTCRCEKGEKHVGQYLTFKEAGKTRTVYVPVDMVEEVKEWIQEHHRIKALDKEISQLCVALIRGHVQHRKRKKGRS